MAHERVSLSIGALLAAVGAVMVLVSLFLDWFEPGLTAWTVFEIIDLLLAALVIAVLGLVVAEVLRRTLPRTASPPLWLLGALALLLVVSQLVNHPPGAQESDPEAGVWLALAGALVIFVGGLLTVVNVTLVKSRGVV